MRAFELPEGVDASVPLDSFQWRKLDNIFPSSRNGQIQIKSDRAFSNDHDRLVK